MLDVEKIIDFYYQGVLNEYEIDNFLMKKDNVDMGGFVVPRYLKVKNHIKNIKRLKFILTLITRCWGFIYSILIFNTFLKVFLKKAFNRSSVEIKGSEITILSSSRTDSIYRRVNSNVTGIYVTVPWKRFKLNRHDIKNISIMEVLTFKDIIWSFKACMNIRKNLKKRCDKFDQSILLQTYDSFNWFLLYRAIYKIEPSCIWFANHYDRWAILFDRIPIQGRKKQMQHGIISREIYLPNKLENIDECYCFDEESKQIFQSTYHNNKITSTEYKIMRNSIKFIDTGDKKVIVFIGGPNDAEKEKLIIENISSKYSDYIIYIKPHPLYIKKMYFKFEQSNVKVISQKDYFPKANLAVSYKSTLAYDYENYGTKVIYHEGKTVKSIMEEITRHMIK